MNTAIESLAVDEAMYACDILAIDPGTYASGVVICTRERVLWSHKEVDNGDVLALLRVLPIKPRVAIEMIASYGMPVGEEVFTTCLWIGRFMQQRVNAGGPTPDLIPRKRVCLHMCNSPRATDSNVRQACIDLLGAPGTKAAPGPTYGVTSHAWQALGLAMTALGVSK